VVGDPNKPNSEHNNKLVHISGKTSNETNLCDRDFSVVAQDSYRLKRKVEMYQWQETFHKQTEKQRAYFTYNKVWSETPIDSTKFMNHGFDNPNLFAWPFRSNSLQGEQIMLGQFKLNSDQIMRLGSNQRTYVQWVSQDLEVL